MSLDKIKLTEAYMADLKLLANNIAKGKIEPMDSLHKLIALVKKHYGDKLDWYGLMGVFQISGMYFQLFTFNRLMLLTRAFDKTGLFKVKFGALIKQLFSRLGLES